MVDSSSPLPGKPGHLVNSSLQLSIILPTKDRHAILFRSLKSILGSTENIRCEILIIDNSTTSDIVLPGELQRDDIRMLKNPRNRNTVFSSRNYGDSIARAPLLLFIDDDIIVNPASILFVLDFHAKNPRTAANVSWTYPPELIAQMQHSLFGRFQVKSGITTMRELYGVDRWKENTVFESGEVASFFFSI